MHLKTFVVVVVLSVINQISIAISRFHLVCLYRILQAVKIAPILNVKISIKTNHNIVPSVTTAIKFSSIFKFKN